MAAVNRNFAELRPPASIAMMDKARALKAQGLDIISLAGGEPAAAGQREFPALLLTAAAGTAWN